MSDNQVELVKQKADIVSIIDGRVKLTKSGRNFKANCPFHGEKTPSFFVSPEMQTFKCFGCGEGGDVFTFLEKFEGMDFPEALEYVARKVGVELKKELRNNDELRRKRLFEALHLAEEYYHYLLTSHTIGRKVLAYLKDRGISESLIKTFKLGYSLDGWQGLQDYLVGKKKYTTDDLEKTGMVIRSSGGRFYDRFRGRLMFPLKDFRGKTVGFSGRVLPGENVDEKEAKYINSPETEIYHKGQMLYGISDVRSDIKKKNRVVLVEGEFDMISSYKAGVREVVAIKGSALTEDQVALLRRLTTNLILALDADAAGSEAMKRGIMIADKMGMNLSVVEVVDGKDPDDLARTNPDLWKKLVQKPVSIYDFLIHKSFQKSDAKTGEGKRAISRELAPVLSRIGNAVEREYYMGVVAEKLAVTKRALEEEVNKVETLGKSTSEVVPKPTTKTLSRRLITERFVLGVFWQLGGDLSEQAHRIHEDWFEDKGHKRLWKEISTVLKANPSLRTKELLMRLPMESQRLVEGLLTQEVMLAGNEPGKADEMFTDGVKELSKITIKERLTELGRMMTGETMDNEEELRGLQMEYAELSKSLKDLS